MGGAVCAGDCMCHGFRCGHEGFLPFDRRTLTSSRALGEEKVKETWSQALYALARAELREAGPAHGPTMRTLELEAHESAAVDLARDRRRGARIVRDRSRPQ